MRGWITSNNRQKHQRRMNHYVRLINKNIANDDLWRGRFAMDQYCAQWIAYENSSEYNLYVALRCIDKKTGRQQFFPLRSVNELCFFRGYKLWEMMNNFIIDYLDVWSEGREALRSDKTDYSKIKISN